MTRPRVPVTLELDVHFYTPPPGAGQVRGAARIIKLGRSVLVSSVDFTSENGDAIGFAAASFVAAPDEAVQLQPGWNGIERHAGRGSRLEVPFAERIRCESPGPGTAILPHAPDVLNAAGTINGGLIATAVEQAMLSLAPPGTTLCSLALRYLLAARVGPVVATAELAHGLSRAEARDAGNAERLCVTATGRIFGP